MNLKEALRIDFSCPPQVSEQILRRKEEFEAKKSEKGESALEGIHANDDKPLPSYSSSVVPKEIYSMYDNIEQAEKVIFILKLCLAQIACGQATIDAEEHAMSAALALGLERPFFEIGPRRMYATFAGNKGFHFMAVSRDITLSKLQDVTSLAILISKGFTNDAAVASSVLDDLMQAPSPYGWLINDILFFGLCVLATICAFFGSYVDMVAVAIITFAVILLQHVIHAFPATLGSSENLLVSFTIGLLASVAWRYVYEPMGEPICNSTVLVLSPLLVYLPGSELIYGAYEIKSGQTMNGAARLVNALVRCMYLSLGLLIGWLVVGYRDNMLDSFIPSQQCPPFRVEGNIEPWWLVFVVLNLALLVFVAGGLQVRPSDLPGIYVVAYTSLVFFGGINFGCSEIGCGLPGYIRNTMGMFVATNLACLREYIAETPAVSGIIPVLLVLAPGSAAVLEILNLIQAENGVLDAKVSDIFTSLTLLGVSYSLGMVLGFVVWKPILERKQTSTIVRKAFDDNKRDQVLYEKY